MARFLAEDRTHHLPNAEMMRYVLCQERALLASLLNWKPLKKILKVQWVVLLIFLSTRLSTFFLVIVTFSALHNEAMTGLKCCFLSLSS